MANRQRRVIVAIDFDNTITSGETFPEIAPIRDGAKRVINNLATKYECCILIFTCREEGPAGMAAQFLRDEGVIFMHFNENCHRRIEFWNCDSRKLGADLYIDDKGFASYNSIDWNAMEQHIYDLVTKIKGNMGEC